jgi:pyruvate dehydrogenase E2 component (dihydrolipoamide acetyltransferase)
VAYEFKLPELGENIETGDVVKVLVSPGDALNKDQPVLELETDKAVVEIPSTVSGKVKELQVKEGDQVTIGQVILTLEEEGESTTEAPVVENGQEREEAVQASGQEKAEEKGKETTAPAAREQGQRVEKPLPAKAQPAWEPEIDGEDSAAITPAPATPSVRRLARELGVDIHQVSGSGPSGRISVEDVKHYVRTLISRRVEVSTPAASAEEAHTTLPLPDFEKWGAIEREPMSKVRRKTAEHMGQAWTIPHVTQLDQADISELEQNRKRFAKRVEQVGGKLTLTAIALKVVASALRIFPRFNASLDIAAKELIYKQYCHIGVAVDTERGLLVPVIRNVDQKNVTALALELTELAEKARARKLSLEEMEGSSFTITNLGGLGGGHFTPVINWPDVAILGISRARMMPVYLEGEFQPRLILPLSLSYDHRVIDGADAVRFLRWIAEALEEPLLLSLEG